MAASKIVPRTSLLDTLAIFADVFFPTLAKGVIIQRPRVLRLAEALDLDRRAMAEAFMEVVTAETGSLRGLVRRHGMLTWDGFSEMWFRIVRRVVFGNAAREDNDLSYSSL